MPRIILLLCPRRKFYRCSVQTCKLLEVSAAFSNLRCSAPSSEILGNPCMTHAKDFDEHSERVQLVSERELPPNHWRESRTRACRSNLQRADQNPGRRRRAASWRDRINLMPLHIFSILGSPPRHGPGRARRSLSAECQSRGAGKPAAPQNQ